jgi:hypothetical protein
MKNLPSGFKRRVFQTDFRQAFFWLILFAMAGLAMLFLFDDGCQQDGGMHYLFARWAWVHEEMFVGVWARPLYTFIYAFPALIGYRAARALTVLICLAISYQTWSLARDLKIDRAPLAIALVWLQPSFFLFCADNMTEPIFALVFVVALRLHHQGRLKAGMIAASLMILARPEGFFLGALWGVWVLKERLRDGATGRWGDRANRTESVAQSPSLLVSLSPLLLLASGAFIWWLAALVITGDPLFIKHNWPADWPMTGTIYGAAGLAAYPARLPEVVGLFLLPVFIYGLWRLLKGRRLYTITSSFLLLFILHTILRAYGLLGSAGYPRYLVTISPAIALITLSGWNELAKRFASVPRAFRTASAGLIIAISALTNFAYADAAIWARDARAFSAAYSWFQSQPKSPPVSRLIWSHPYSCILFDSDPWKNHVFTRNRGADLKTLSASPAGTLVVWDDQVGPNWTGLRAKDFEEEGYLRLYAEPFNLKGYLLDRSLFGYGGPRAQTIYLLYKP